MLKRGAAGASWFGRDGSRIDAAAFAVTELDATGAGDCFGGAYVAGSATATDAAGGWSAVWTRSMAKDASPRFGLRRCASWYR